MKKILFAALSSLIFLLTGCYDANEPNNIAYIVALGVDTTADDNIYEFTVQFAKTTQISGGSSEEGGKEGSDIVEIISIKAPTIYSAVNIANQIVSKKFNLAHTKLIVISDEIAKSGISNLFDTLGRNSDIRPNIYMAVSNGKAKDYLEAVKPVAEINPITYYRLIYESAYGGYVPKIILKDFYFQLDGKDKQNVLPLSGVNTEQVSDEESENSSSDKSSQDGEEKENTKFNKRDTKVIEINKQGFNYLLKKYTAGNMDVDKKNASEVIGMAVFKGDKMIGTMDSIDSLIYNILRGSFDLSYVSYYKEETPDSPVTIAIEQERKPQISVKIEDDKPKIKIKLFLEGQLISESTENPIEYELKSAERVFADETKQAINEFLTHTLEYDSDIIGFGQHAKKNFLTYDQFKKYDWYSHYSESKFDVDVEFKVRRIGFIDLSKNQKGDR